MNSRRIILLALALVLVHCTEHQRSVLFSAGKEHTLKIEKLTIQTFETAYDRQEVYFDQRLVGYVGSSYLVDDGEADGHMVLPVKMEKLRDVPVVRFGIKKTKGSYPWFLYVDPRKFSLDEFKAMEKLLAEIRIKNPLIIHNAYYLDGLVYCAYRDLFETYISVDEKYETIQVAPDGKVFHMPDRRNPGTASFLGEFDGKKVEMKRYWVKKYDFSKFRAGGKIFSEEYVIVLTEGM